MMLKNVFTLSLLATIASHASGKVLGRYPPNVHEIHRRAQEENETSHEGHEHEHGHEHEGGTTTGTITKVYIENTSADTKMWVYAYLPGQWGWTYSLEEGEKQKVGETKFNTLTWRAWVFDPNSTTIGFFSMLGCGENNAGNKNTITCKTNFTADDGGSFTLVLDDAMVSEAKGGN